MRLLLLLTSLDEDEGQHGHGEAGYGQTEADDRDVAQDLLVLQLGLVVETLRQGEAERYR